MCSVLNVIFQKFFNFCLYILNYTIYVLLSKWLLYYMVHRIRNIIPLLCNVAFKCPLFYLIYFGLKSFCAAIRILTCAFYLHLPGKSLSITLFLLPFKCPLVYSIELNILKSQFENPFL